MAKILVQCAFDKMDDIYKLIPNPANANTHLNESEEVEKIPKIKCPNCGYEIEV